MIWVKALHLIFMVAWFAGLFYLPRLFVNHALAEDEAVRERLAIMETKLYRFIPKLWGGNILAQKACMHEVKEDGWFFYEM